MQTWWSVSLSLSHFLTLFFSLPPSISLSSSLSILFYLSLSCGPVEGRPECLGPHTHTHCLYTCVHTHTHTRTAYTHVCTHTHPHERETAALAAPQTPWGPDRLCQPTRWGRGSANGNLTACHPESSAPPPSVSSLCSPLLPLLPDRKSTRLNSSHL